LGVKLKKSDPWEGRNKDRATGSGEAVFPLSAGRLSSAFYADRAFLPGAGLHAERVDKTDPVPILFTLLLHKIFLKNYKFSSM